MFALIFTVSDGWREHAQERWPAVVATIEHCRVDQHIPLDRANRGPVWYVKCSINYLAGGSSIETSIRSRSTGSGWGGHLNLMRQWVAEHPPDSRMDVHYDPADPKNRNPYLNRHARRGTAQLEQPQAAANCFGRVPLLRNDREASALAINTVIFLAPAKTTRSEQASEPPACRRPATLDVSRSSRSGMMS